MTTLTARLQTAAAAGVLVGVFLLFVPGRTPLGTPPGLPAPVTVQQVGLVVSVAALLGLLATAVADAD